MSATAVWRVGGGSQAKGVDLEMRHLAGAKLRNFERFFTTHFRLNQAES